MIKEYNFVSEEEAYKEGKRMGAIQELDLIWNSLIKGRTKCLVREELAQFLENEKEKLEVKKQ